MRKRWFTIVVALIIISLVPYSNGYGINNSYASEYIDFMNIFFPGSPSFSIAISYHPDGVINTYYGKLTYVTINFQKINITCRKDIFFRFIITNSMWSPYKQPSSSDGYGNFMKKLKLYNNWVNNTISLTKNVYYLSKMDANFMANMTNMSIPISFKIYGWGKGWGITILAREKNMSLWVPVGGLPINSKNSDGLLFGIITYAYILSVAGILWGTVAYLRFKRLHKIGKLHKT